MAYPVVHVYFKDKDGQETSRQWGCVDEDPSISEIADLVASADEFTKCGVSDVRLSKSLIPELTTWLGSAIYPTVPDVSATITRRAEFEYEISPYTTSNKNGVFFDLPDPKAVYSLPDTDILDKTNSWFGDWGEYFDDGNGLGIGFRGAFHTNNQEQVKEGTGNSSFKGGKVVD